MESWCPHFFLEVSKGQGKVTRLDLKTVKYFVFFAAVELRTILFPPIVLCFRRHRSRLLYLQFFFTYFDLGFGSRPFAQEFSFRSCVLFAYVTFSFCVYFLLVGAAMGATTPGAYVRWTAWRCKSLCTCFYPFHSVRFLLTFVIFFFCCRCDWTDSGSEAGTSPKVLRSLGVGTRGNEDLLALLGATPRTGELSKSPSFSGRYS